MIRDMIRDMNVLKRIYCQLRWHITSVMALAKAKKLRKELGKAIVLDIMNRASDCNGDEIIYEVNGQIEQKKRDKAYLSLLIKNYRNMRKAKW